jgi:site-specific recombinase XerD
MPPRVDRHLELPATTRRFLRTARGRRTRRAVCALHRWLARRGRALATLTPAHLDEFVACPLETVLTPPTATAYRNQLRPYLTWLHQRQLLGFDPERLRRHPKRLPPEARAFLASLAPTTRPGTRANYTVTLRRFHAWLDEHALTPPQLHRPDLAAWSQQLHALHLHPSSHLRFLLQTRVYLRWLDERQPLASAPDDLIRPRDLPQLPQYLPRPLSPAADHELQRRLAASTAPWHHALLLMRRTGLRSAELRGLEYHCVRADAHHPLLKVPLGKLLTERLVPLDPTAVTLIQRLQALPPRPRPWLIPGVNGRQPKYRELHAALATVAAGLPDPAPVTSHRLRHTYATELLSAGMSLVALMRLLGHRDYHMTLRYTAITPELVGQEYAQALTQLTTKYRLPAALPPEPDSSPVELLDHLGRWLRQHAPAHQHLRPLLQRLARLRVEFEHLPS